MKIFHIFAPLTRYEFIMKTRKFGYYKETYSAQDMKKAREQLTAFGCDSITTDSVDHNVTRPNRKALMEKIKRGDTLVLYKFANAVRGLSQMSCLLEACRIRGIRVVSTDDHIDTADPVSEAWQSFIGSFPVDCRAGERAGKTVKTAISEFGAAKFASKSVRDQYVIDLYRENLPIEEIFEQAGITKSTFYRILRSNHIPRQRNGSIDPKGIDMEP